MSNNYTCIYVKKKSLEKKHIVNPYYSKTQVSGSEVSDHDWSNHVWQRWSSWLVTQECVIRTTPMGPTRSVSQSWIRPQGSRWPTTVIRIRTMIIVWVWTFTFHILLSEIIIHKVKLNQTVNQKHSIKVIKHNFSVQ